MQHVEDIKLFFWQSISHSKTRNSHLATGWKTRAVIPAQAELFLISTTHNSSLCSNQAYIHLSPASVLHVESPRVDFVIQFHLEPTLDMCGALGYFDSL